MLKFHKHYLKNMDEALKTNRIRSKEFFTKYLSGKVIDIGAGPDLVIPTAERFDIDDGDANHITQFRKTESYDTVHSSHCLEHMFNPVNALNEWWSLVKPGGYLILVVPDEDLYEQGIWPSMFNPDHKNTFRLNKNKSWSPVSFEIEELVKNLPDVQIISAEIQDKNYDYQLKTSYPTEYKRIPFLLRALKRIIRKLPLVGRALLVKYENILFKNYGFPIDQTIRDALAQIQIVTHKVA